MQRVLRFLGSLWLTFPLLALIALVLAAGGGLLTFAGITFIDLAVGALRLDMYGSPWFGGLMGLLMLNLIVCTVIRKPWRFWQWGFLATHTGVLTLLIGATVTYYFKIYGQMPLREGEEASSFSLEGESELRWWVNEDPDKDEPRARVPLHYNVYRKQKPDDTFPLRNGWFLRVEEFLPHVDERDAYVTQAGGLDTAIEIETGGSGRPDKFFMRDGAVVSYGPLEVEFSPLSEAALANLLPEAGADGTLWVRHNGEEREIDIAASKEQTITVGGRDFRVREVRASPAGDRDMLALFESTYQGKSGEFVVSALHPERTPVRVTDGERDTSFEARLRVNLKASVLWFMQTPSGLRALATSASGARRLIEVPLGSPVRYPFMQVPFEFTVRQVVENALRVPVETKLRKDDQRRPAVRLRVLRGDVRSAPTWLSYGMVRSVDVGGERVMIGFLPKEHPLGMTVRLNRVKVPVRPGTRQAARYESDLTIYDPAMDGGVRYTTGVNYPATHKGWVFYQASVLAGAQPGVFNGSVFQVAWDPGKKVLYLGGLMTVSGTIFMLFLKPFLVRLLQRAKAAGVPLQVPGKKVEAPEAVPLPAGAGEPMRDGAVILTLTLLSVGTLVGSAMMFARASWTGVGIGFFVAGLDVLAVFLGCWAAKRSPAIKAVQIGQAVAATWILNTAALVLFMWVKVQG